MSTTVPSEYDETDRAHAQSRGLAEQRQEQLARRTHQLQHERARPRGRELAALRAQHARRCPPCRCRRAGCAASTSRANASTRRGSDDGARRADDERDRIARQAGERAARNRADQRAAALQARHRGDRAAELVTRADVREIRLTAEHPCSLTRAERDGRDAERPRVGRDAEREQTAEQQTRGRRAARACRRSARRASRPARRTAECRRRAGTRSTPRTPRSRRATST